MFRVIDGASKVPLAVKSVLLPSISIFAHLSPTNKAFPILQLLLSQLSQIYDFHS